MKIKKQYIEAVLLTIHTFNSETGAPIHGLLWENITLGTKRKLQNISKQLRPHSEQFKSDLIEVKEAPEDKRPEEIEILINEEVEISAEHISLAEIEAIQTDKNYSFEIIEMIAK